MVAVRPGVVAGRGSIHSVCTRCRRRLFLSVDSIYNIVQFSYRLALIPDEFQGRVNSAFRLISYSLRPVGIALTGALMQLIGIVPTAVVFAVILALLALVASLNAHIRKALPPAQIRAE